MLARPRAAIAAALLAAAALAVLLAPGAALAAKQRQISGTVPMRGMNVVLYAARPGGSRLYGLGAARSGPGGAYAIRYRGAGDGLVKYLVATRPGGGAEAGFPVPANAYRLAAALGAGPVPGRADVNERTTVAIGFAMAQFIQRNGRIAGENPGLRNAAAMTRNLVSRRSGALAPTIRRFPNGRSTSTLPTFGSLANLLALCRQQDRRCAQLLSTARVPGGAPAADTLAATVAIARYPWHGVRRLFALSRAARPLYTPALGKGQRPDAWTLALRFEGAPRTMDGPGAFAIDSQGSLWVANNYEYSRSRLKPVCAAENLLRFTPIGRAYPGSPYTGGGLTGAGFGISIDPRNHVWVGNFGFAAPECPEQPPHNSVSEFTIDGEALSPDLERLVTKEGTVLRGGYEQGDISWPQSTIPDQQGNIWIANCGNNSVTRYARGNPEVATNLGEKLLGLKKPFGAAVAANGNVYVTGNESNSVAILNRDGVPVGPPLTGGGLHRPMGIAVDSQGYAWVSSSGKVPAPCPTKFNLIPGKGTAVLIKPNGKLARRNPISGGGLSTPWGVAIDGDDNVWFANFTGKRLSALCGSQPQNCPAGKRRTGASLAPRKNGYGFDGLVRSTGVAIDPSGNVWLTNNWKVASIPANPGGFQIVAFLGLAAPVHTPLIGPPEQP